MSNSKSTHESARRTYEPTDLLDETELAEFLNVTPQYVRTGYMRNPKWDPPPRIEIAPRVKRWMFADVLVWLDARRKHPGRRIREAS